MADNPEQKSNSIPEFFKGKCVFITGATGFLGKVLLEKLLRSCPDVQEILVLIRPGKQGTPENRLLELLNHKAFDRIRVECAEVLQKVKPLSGDIVDKNLGLSDEHLQKVINEASIFFHCAANVRFDDEPKSTLSMNLLGVKNVLEVCHAMTKLEVLVHVSTAYCFCNYCLIEECIYPEGINPERIIDALRLMTNDQLRTLCEFYLEGRPSLYHFSKALAENLLAASRPRLPIIIVRPSIVTASVNEPFKGWIDNFNGPSGFLAVCGNGVVRTLLVHEDVNADWVPVDTVANTLIVAAHYVAVKSKLLKPDSKLSCPSTMPVVNCVCPNSNLLTWMEVVNLCLPFLIKYPSSKVWNMPGGTVTSSYLRYKMCLIFYHYVPAYFIDTIFLILGKKPRIVNMYRRFHGVMNHLQHYTTNQFNFSSKNMRKLVEHMEPEDAVVFPIDQNKLDWKEYMQYYVLGVRRYFLLESDATLESSRRQMMKYYYLWMSLKIASVLGTAFLLRNHCLKLGAFLRNHYLKVGSFFWYILPSLPSSKSFPII